MKRILITGSADGLGELATKALIDKGHRVVLHARNEKRAKEALEKIPGAETCLIADLGSRTETIDLAKQINAMGSFDAIIHNAAVYNVSSDKLLTINVIAPYILTCLVQKPERLIYISSDMHLQGHSKLENLHMESSTITYSDTKLLLLMLCKAVARKWPDVYANAVDPGWVPTKMGGVNAPDDLQKGYETQVWLASSDEQKAKVSGRYFFHKKEANSHPEGDNAMMQEELLKQCAAITDIIFSS